MKQIRRLVFETNSSSTHSIVISAGDYVPDKLSVVDGVCEIRTGEFGWGIDYFTDAATKAAYCLTYLKEEVPDVAREEMFIRVLRKATGAAEIRFVPEFSDEEAAIEKLIPYRERRGLYHQWGHIDHQSLENATGAEPFQSDELLERFIFHPKSILIIDNDKPTT
jgi:hypothetical protein